MSERALEWIAANVAHATGGFGGCLDGVKLVELALAVARREEELIGIQGASQEDQAHDGKGHGDTGAVVGARQAPEVEGAHEVTKLQTTIAFLRGVVKNGSPFFTGAKVSSVQLVIDSLVAMQREWSDRDRFFARTWDAD